MSQRQPVHVEERLARHLALLHHQLDEQMLAAGRVLAEELRAIADGVPGDGHAERPVAEPAQLLEKTVAGKRELESLGAVVAEQQGARRSSSPAPARTVSSTPGKGPQLAPEREPIHASRSPRRQSAVPSGGCASRSSTTTRPVNPSWRKAATATAMSLIAQKPPARPTPAWWNPPDRFSSRRATLCGPRRRQERAACNVPPQARRMLVITSSGRTSPGSTEKMWASVSARWSESSSSGEWTRARSS